MTNINQTQETAPGKNTPWEITRSARTIEEVARTLFVDSDNPLQSFKDFVKDQKVLNIAAGGARMENEMLMNNLAAACLSLDTAYGTLDSIDSFQKNSVMKPATNLLKIGDSFPEVLRFSPISWANILVKQTNGDMQLDPSIQHFLPTRIISSFGWPYWITLSIPEIRLTYLDRYYSQLVKDKLVTEKEKIENINQYKSTARSMTKEEVLQQALSVPMMIEKLATLLKKSGTIVKGRFKPASSQLAEFSIEDPVLEEILNYCRKSDVITASLVRKDSVPKVLCIDG